MITSNYTYSGMTISEHDFIVPLSYNDPDGENISIFAREIYSSRSLAADLPYLVFFQGGPGYESPRPITNSGWIKRAIQDYRVLLLDQRGTGRSSVATFQTLKQLKSQKMAEWLQQFRADNIVRDAEMIRKALIGSEKWSILGQSFGGFCATNYLSFYPDGLKEVYITGGLPPLTAHPDDIYRRTYKRVEEKNKLFYSIFPDAHDYSRRIADYLLNHDVHLPNGDPLTVERFQQLGLQLGFSDGMATLNFLLENAFASEKLSYSFLKGLMCLQSFDTNPIFTILHEACYAQEFATNWSAHRIRKEFPQFEIEQKDNFYFTGEMLYPWMLDEFQTLKPLKRAANLLAEKADWPILYDDKILTTNNVPVAAAVYTNDMYVDRDYSIETANIIKGIEIWETNEYEHNGLRSDGKYVLDLLFSRLS